MSIPEPCIICGHEDYNAYDICDVCREKLKTLLAAIDGESLCQQHADTLVESTRVHLAKNKAIAVLFRLAVGHRLGRMITGDTRESVESETLKEAGLASVPIEP